MKTKKITCWRCGSEFTATVDDLTAFPSECRPCIDRLAERDRSVINDREAKRTKDIEAHLAEICPTRFRTCDEALIPSREAYRKALDWSVGSKGLLMQGTSGRGKTRALWGICAKLMRSGIRVEIMTETQFGHQVGKRSYVGTLWDWIESLCSVDVLAIDDMGKAPRTDRFIAELFHVIDQRIAWERPLLITTQLSGTAIAQGQKSEATGEALVRRLSEACEIIRF